MRGRSTLLLFGGALALFAVAGVVSGRSDSTGVSVAAMGVAVGGVYATAVTARAVSRRILAQLALGLWLAFIAVAGAHVVGLMTVANGLPGSTVVAVLVLTALTWATFLGACATTAFLGFREYGSSPQADTPEERVLDGNFDSDRSPR